LEARIIPERIEHRIEPEQRGRERRLSSAERALVGDGEQLSQGDIVEKIVVLRLFFEERFQFAAGVRQPSCAATWLPATACVQPNQKRSSPVK
jgi:hypothetical protein